MKFPLGAIPISETRGQAKSLLNVNFTTSPGFFCTTQDVQTFVKERDLNVREHGMFMNTLATLSARQATDFFESSERT